MLDSEVCQPTFRTKCYTAPLTATCSEASLRLHHYSLVITTKDREHTTQFSKYISPWQNILTQHQHYTAVDSLSAHSYFSVTCYDYEVLEMYELPLLTCWETSWIWYGQPHPASSGLACASSRQLWGRLNFFSWSQQSTELKHMVRSWCIQLEAWKEQTNNMFKRWQTSPTRNGCFPHGKSYSHKHKLQRKLQENWIENFIDLFLKPSIFFPNYYI